MSFMDKVKQQAEQAMVKAQQGVQQGQTKLNEMQAGKSHDALLRDLGAAYYAQQRSGGSADAVTAAVEALDTHATDAAAAAAAPQPGAATFGGSGAPAAPAAGGAAATGGGSFGLDDV
jgi:hypothetical protein